MSNSLESLTQINLDDLVNAFGWKHHAWFSRMVRTVFLRPARDFARQMVDFDHTIGERGLVEAACLTERLYVRDARVFGADCLPAGPCLFLANHPGMTDTLALFTALACPICVLLLWIGPFSFRYRILAANSIM